MGPLAPGLPSEQPCLCSGPKCPSLTQDPAEEEPSLAPLPPPSHAPGSGVHGSWELLSQTEETGMGQLCLSPSPAGPGPQADPLSPGLDWCVPVPGPGSPDSPSEGAKRASLPKVVVPSAHPPGLSEAPTGPAHNFPCSQSHKVSDGCMWSG